jgi:hypothetical protein
MSALGHLLQMHSAPVPMNVRYASDSDQIADAPRRPLCAKSRHPRVPVKRAARRNRHRANRLKSRNKCIAMVFGSHPTELSRDAIFRMLFSGGTPYPHK